MLDHFTVFTKGGIVLFSTEDERPLVGNPVSELIASVLLEVRVMRCKADESAGAHRRAQLD